MVEDVRGSEFTKLCEKHEATRKALRSWNKEVFGHCQSRINDLQQKITDVQGSNPSEYMGRIEANLQTELSEWPVRSESLWRQKSRELWLKAGDKNSSFFHLSTIIRRRHNNIDAIKADNGTWINGSRNIKHFFFDKFKELFSEEEVDFRIILRVSFILLYQKRIMRGYVPSLPLRTSEPLCS